LSAVYQDFTNAKKAIYTNIQKHTVIKCRAMYISVFQKN